MTGIVGLLQWLAQQGITALVEADGERMRASSATPWTFVASGGPLNDGQVHFDATSGGRIIQLAVSGGGRAARTRFEGSWVAQKGPPVWHPVQGPRPAIAPSPKSSLRAGSRVRVTRPGLPPVL